MIERFLRYSLERGKPIRLMWQDEQGIRQANVQIVAFDEKEISFLTLRPKHSVTCAVAQLLSADYKKGDEGQ